MSINVLRPTHTHTHECPKYGTYHDMCRAVCTSTQRVLTHAQACMMHSQYYENVHFRFVFRQKNYLVETHYFTEHGSSYLTQNSSCCINVHTMRFEPDHARAYTHANQVHSARDVVDVFRTQGALKVTRISDENEQTDMYRHVS